MVAAVTDAMDKTFIDYEGGRVRYYQVGRGPDILFIHGSPGSIDDWLPVKDGLVSNFRLTFFDRPGYGGSDALRQGYDEERHADAVFALIDKLELIDPVVVGHSFGGSIALAMAIRRPRGIKTFICVSARAYPKARSPLIFHLFKRPFLGRVLIEILRTTPGRRMMRPALIKMFVPNEASMPLDFIATRTAQWLSKGAMVSLGHEDTNSSSILRKISLQYQAIEHPLVVVHGAEDRAVTVDDARSLHENLKHCRLCIFPDTGHMVQFIRTDELVRIISETAA